MATKRLKVADVERTLFDMACGACGGVPMEIDEHAVIQATMYAEDAAKFAQAVLERYFPDNASHCKVVWLFSVRNMTPWTDYKTLAMAIVEVDTHIKKQSAAKENA